MKTTGSKEIKANNPRTATDVHDTASPEEVSWCKVVPAWMATNEGGATPEKETQSRNSNHHQTIGKFATCNSVAIKFTDKVNVKMFCKTTDKILISTYVAAAYIKYSNNGVNCQKEHTEEIFSDNVNARQHCLAVFSFLAPYTDLRQIVCDNHMHCHFPPLVLAHIMLSHIALHY